MRIRRIQAVIVDRKTKKVLIIRIPHVITKKLEWRLVKGGLERGESEISALKREIFEELGLKNIKIADKIYEYEYNYPPRVRNHVNCYLVYTDKNNKLKLSIEENIKTFRWVGLKEATKKLRFKEEKDAVKNSISEF